MSLTTVSYSINLEQETVFAAGMCKLCLDGFADRILAVKSFLYDLLHDRNVPYISEQAVHLNNILQCKAGHCKALFHIVERAVDLLFDGASDVSDTITDKTEIAGLDNA